MEDETVINTTPKQSNKMSPVVIGIIILAVALIGLKMIQAKNQGATPTNKVVVENATPTPDPTVTTQAMEAMQGDTMAPTASPDASATTTPAGDVQIISIEGGSFYFKPNEIRVKKGQKVRIEMKSVSMMHDFVIDELKVKMPVTKSGDTGVVEFTPDKVGTFEFYCSVANHRAQGQIGKLIVE